jgi:multidrug efflux pump subunit AcrA (membrane-fusion protein)
VAAPVAGVIQEVLCQAGQKVKKDDPLVQLDDRLAVAAEQQAAAALAEAKASLQLKTNPRPEQTELAGLKIEQAHRAVDFAQRNLARQEELAKDEGTAVKTLEQARLDLSAAQNDLAVAEHEQALLKPTPDELAEEEAKVAAAEAAFAAARTQREMLRIVSPIDATVIAVNGNPGESVDTTKVLIDLVGLDRLVVIVDVPVEESGSLVAGMPAQVVLPSNSIDGKIYFVGSEVDRKDNTIPVSIDLPPGSGLKPGESVDVRIVAEEHKDVLAVPKESVVADENGDSFIALLSGDQATHKTAHIGLREGDLVEVQADGLKDGDLIVGNGAYGLAKFQVAKVKVVEN